MRQYKNSNRRLHWAAVALLAGTLAGGQLACAGRANDDATNTAPTVELAGLQDHFARVADRVTPSIVAISALGADPAAHAEMLIGAQVDGPQLAAALRQRLRVGVLWFSPALDRHLSVTLKGRE